MLANKRPQIGKHFELRPVSEVHAMHAKFCAILNSDAPYSVFRAVQFVVGSKAAYCVANKASIAAPPHILADD